jgi:GTPase SAR1 family protein
MTRVYYKEAVGAFIVFDVTRQPTFDAVNKWKQDLDSKVQMPDGSAIPCILLANKVGKHEIFSLMGVNNAMYTAYSFLSFE